MTSRTFTQTKNGNTYLDWYVFARQKAEDYGYAWLIESPPGVYQVRASTDREDEPYAFREAFYGLMPVPRRGLSNEDRIEILEQQVAELQAQLEKRI